MSKNTAKQGDVTPKETTAVATQTENVQAKALAMRAEAQAMQGQMKEMGIQASDLVIPKLLLMQNTSGLVGDGKAKLADIVNSQTNEVVSGEGKELEVVPLKLYKTLKTYNADEEPPKFIREEPLTPELEKLSFEGNEDGVAVKRYINMNFFVLLKSDIAEEEAFPLVVSFKSTSLFAGKQFATELFKRIQLGQLPYSKTVKIAIRKDKKEKNTYAVFEIAKGEKCSDSEKQAAEKWLSTLASVQYTVDSSDDVEEESRSSPVGKPTVVDAQVVGSDSGPY